MRDLESLSREELIDVIIDRHRLIEGLRVDLEQLKKRGSAAPRLRGSVFQRYAQDQSEGAGAEGGPGVFPVSDSA